MGITPTQTERASMILLRVGADGLNAILHKDVNLMRRLPAVLFGILLGGGLVFLAFQFHVVRAAEGHLFIRKQQYSITDSYVDIRKWGAGEWQEHPVLARALIEQGRGDLVVAPTSRDLLRQLFQKFGGAFNEPTDTRSDTRSK